MSLVFVFVNAQYLFGRMSNLFSIIYLSALRSPPLPRPSDRQKHELNTRQNNLVSWRRWLKLVLGENARVPFGITLSTTLSQIRVSALL